MDFYYSVRKAKKSLTISGFGLWRAAGNLVDNGTRVSQRTGVGDSTSRLYVGGFRHKISLEHLAPIVEGLEIKKPHRSWSMHGESVKTKRSHFTP